MSDVHKVKPMDRSRPNSPVVNSTHGESTVVMDADAKTCRWNGDTFDEGSIVECGQDRYECSFGQWIKIE